MWISQKGSPLVVSPCGILCCLPTFELLSCLVNIAFFWALDGLTLAWLAFYWALGGLTHWTSGLAVAFYWALDGLTHWTSAGLASLLLGSRWPHSLNFWPGCSLLLGSRWPHSLDLWPGYQETKGKVFTLLAHVHMPRWNTCVGLLAMTQSSDLCYHGNHYPSQIPWLNCICH